MNVYIKRVKNATQDSCNGAIGTVTVHIQF